jgi:cytochrome b561
MLKWQTLLAKANHVLLYTMVIAMPLSGYLGSVFSGYPIKWFGVTLPAWGWADPTIKDGMSVVHLTTSWILLVSLCLHITGTIKHTLAGDRVMARMGFGGKTADTRAPATAVSAPPG